jgi:hypothetical protein
MFGHAHRVPYFILYIIFWFLLLLIMGYLIDIDFLWGSGRRVQNILIFFLLRLAGVDVMPIHGIYGEIRLKYLVFRIG